MFPKFANIFGDIASVKSMIFIFSIIGLIAVIYVLRLRIRGLQAKALTVFKYLTSLGAIKEAKEKFKPTLNEIERYLNDDHWTLAEYWVNRIQVDYSQFFLENVKDGKNVKET